MEETAMEGDSQGKLTDNCPSEESECSDDRHENNEGPFQSDIDTIVAEPD